jgi:putative DNA methylase
MSIGFAPKAELSSPEIWPLPATTERRLIDDGTLHHEASTAGFAERYRRGETPHTVHVWWARRPHSAMRPLVFACLSKDRSIQGHSLMDGLSVAPIGSALALGGARGSLREDYARSPRVLDMFGGGGTIAFEAVSLGADVCSLDSNEMAVFIQKSILVYPQKISADMLLDHVRSSGKKVLEKLSARTADFFSDRSNTFAYFWTYSTACRSCGYRFYLTKRPWLSRKSGRRVALELADGREQQNILVGAPSTEQEFKSPWVGRKGSVRCPACGQVTPNIKISDCRDELVAAGQLAGSHGKRFCEPPSHALPRPEALAVREGELLSSIGMTLPTSRMPEWSGIVNPSVYGMTTHSDFLNPRQRVVLLTLIECLGEEFQALSSSVSGEVARAVVSILSGLVDQLVDWNCRLSMWIPQNEQVGRAFCGPGIAMLWDYTETDPVSEGPSNLWDKLDRIVAGTHAISTLQESCDVRHGCAQDLPFEDNSFDAIVTDPPYYDNIYYNALADFFFAWKRPLLSMIDADLCRNIQTNSTHELVSSSRRSGHPVKAHADYCRELARAISEAERVLRPEGVFALLYSHSSLKGWEALVRAYRPRQLRITSVQPLSIERKQRPRAMTSEAVNTCVVFVCHKDAAVKSTAQIGSLCDALIDLVRLFRANLSNAGWHTQDVALAAYAQGVGMLANISRVTGVDNDLEALVALEGIVRKEFPDFRVSTRKSL